MVVLNPVRRCGVACLGGVLTLVFAAPTSAHGGAYRGPPQPLVPPPGGGGPMTGGPSAPGFPSPTSNPLPIQTSSLTSWQFWWEHNKDPFLRLKDSIHDMGTVSGSDEFYMGNTVRQGKRSLEPTLAEKRDVILPALKDALESSPNRDIATACMVAMAKIGIDRSELEILPVFRRHLRRGHQEVRETAALCLGISQRPDAVPDLLALALDLRVGRKLVDSARVDDRTRAFATYGLGLVAWAHEDTNLKRQVFGALRGLLEETDDRDLRVATIQAIGLLNPDPNVPGHKRLLWQAVETLWNFYEKDLGKGNQLVQAHAPTAIARLLGRGRTAEHERFKKRFGAELDLENRSRHNAIYQSAALALGKIVLPREKHLEDAVYADLMFEYFRRGKDQLARFFCLVAAAEIGGEHVRGELLELLTKSRKNTERPWVGVALGVLAFHERTRYGGAVDRTIGQMLLQNFEDLDNEESRSAMAVGLGLCGFVEAVPAMLGRLKKIGRRQLQSGYICIGLALMPAPEALDQVREVVDEAVRRPTLLTQAAIALGKLGDKAAIDQLNAIIADSSPSVAKLSGVATAYRFIGDRRAIRPLVKLLADDQDLTKLSRAFVAAALGGIGDKELLPWNEKIAVGTNYRAVVDTLTNGLTGVLDIL